MTEESQFRPRLDDLGPKRDATDVSGSLIHFDVVEDDFNEDLHFGALRADSLALFVDPGTGKFKAIVMNGEIQSDSPGFNHSVLIVPRIVHTGSSLTDATLTGRFRQRTTIWYLPREFFADGQRIGVRVCASDAYGYELDETYYFTMHTWKALRWPQFSLLTDDGAGPLSIVPFLWYPRGTTSDVSLKLYWGKDSSFGLDLDDAKLAVRCCDTDGQGKQVVESGYCSFKKAGDEDWQQLSAESDIHLGSFPTGGAEDITLRLTIPEGASITGEVLLTLSLTAVRASLTGTRLCGSELTGGSKGHLRANLGRDFRFYIYMSVMAPDIRDYFQNHFIEPLPE